MAKRDKRYKRVTEASLRKKRKKVFDVIPVSTKDLVDNETRAICNVFFSLSIISRKYNIYIDYIRMLMWLYQFEFFEKRYVMLNYNIVYDKQYEHATRHAQMCFDRLIKHGYIDVFKHRSTKYMEEEDRGRYVREEEFVSETVYRLTDKGNELIKDLFETMNEYSPKLTLGSGDIVIN